MKPCRLERTHENLLRNYCGLRMSEAMRGIERGRGNWNIPSLLILTTFRSVISLSLSAGLFLALSLQISLLSLSPYLYLSSHLTPRGQEKDERKSGCETELGAASMDASRFPLYISPPSSLYLGGFYSHSFSPFSLFLLAAVNEIRRGVEMTSLFS